MPKDELIAALEKATGGSHALDAEVGKAMGWERRIHAGWYPPDVMEKARRAKQAPYRFGTAGRLPAFTASIDAALALIPEGWRPYAADFSIAGRARWSLEGPKTQWETDENGDQGPGNDWFAQGIGRTIATAICIAALRATERGEAGR